MKANFGSLKSHGVVLIGAGLMALSLGCDGSEDRKINDDSLHPCVAGLERVGTACVAPSGAGDVEVARNTVGSAGGLVESPDGTIRLEIRAGAIAEDIEFSIAAADPTQVPAGVLPGSAFVMGPAGQSFDVPVRLILEVSIHTVGSDVDVSQYQLAYLGTTIEPLDSRQYDETEQSISGTTTHFSMFGLVDADNSSNNSQDDVGQPYADVGYPDAGSEDAGHYSDASYPDTSDTDAGYPDTSYPDTSYPDTSYPDTTVYPDTSYPDASYPDAGGTDAGGEYDTGTCGQTGESCGYDADCCGTMICLEYQCYPG